MWSGGETTEKETKKEAVTIELLPVQLLPPHFLEGLKLSSTERAIPSGQVEAVKVHHLGPCSSKVVHELVFRIVRGVNFSDGSEFGV